MTPKEAINLILENSIVVNCDGGRVDEAIKMLRETELMDVGFIESRLATATGYKHAVLSELLREYRTNN